MTKSEKRKKVNICIGVVSQILGILSIVAIFAVSAYGYGSNIVALIHTTSFTPLTGLLVLRIIGIIFFPIGIVAGYF